MAARQHARSGTGVLAVLLVCAATLRHARTPEGDNLRPRKDALEYAVLANRLAGGDAPDVPIGDRVYPTRYPLGFPLLLAPSVLARTPPHHLWRVTAIFGVAGVVLTYWAALRLTSPIAATWAALLLAAAPRYAYWSVHVMSDVPAAMLTALWALLLTGSAFAGLGIASGFACTVRLMEVPLLAVGAFAALARGWRQAARFATGAMLGLLPLLSTAIATGHSPGSGYAFWPAPAARFTMSAAAANFPVYAETLCGAAHPRFYSYLVPPFVVVGIWAGLRSHRRATVLAVVSAAAVHVMVALFYYFRASRLLLPILPLLLLLGALGFEQLLSRRTMWTGLLGTAALFLQLRAALAGGPTPPDVPHVAPTLLAVARRLPPDALVVSDVAAPLAWLYWIRGTGRHFMPLAALPHDVGGDLADDYVDPLVRLAARGVTVAPGTFLHGDHVAPAGRAVLAGPRATSVVVVLCTEYGRRELAAALAPVAVASPTVTVSGCQVATIRGKARSSPEANPGATAEGVRPGARGRNPPAREIGRRET